MSLDDLERARLAARQAEIVGALLADGPIPEGFDKQHVDNARRVLREKRKRIAERRKRSLSRRAARHPGRHTRWRTLWRRLCVRWRTNSYM